ncbi:hypothetical protein [[Mycobacterium] nativiensis]|uniref:Transposase n=1 Tax=[Mycobacterium] nativiensis TaxID=2855503 RepID=A0ABU5XT24_9MYCO|nr:hypothetical protein [Mycolicibacter sp. MYC340]MEB3031083.1 hypothetical protein [Mycolicibacter sp. MYC340]
MPNPSISDVVKLTSHQWSQLKDSGLYRLAVIHRQMDRYTPHGALGSVHNPEAVVVYA